MVDFPTLSRQANTTYSDEIIKPFVKTNFEGNYAQTRPKYTRATKKFKLKFRPLNITDKATIETFFTDNIGSSFNWTSPLDNVIYIVRFAEDTLKFTHILSGKYELNISFEQV